MNKVKNQFKQLDEKQLVVEAEKLRRELFTLKLASISSPVKDYKQLGKLKKDIARVLTVLHEKRRQGT
jgi:ribosomal protein L29